MTSRSEQLRIAHRFSHPAHFLRDQAPTQRGAIGGLKVELEPYGPQLTSETFGNNFFSPLNESIKTNQLFSLIHLS